MTNTVYLLVGGDHGMVIDEIHGVSAISLES